MKIEILIFNCEAHKPLNCPVLKLLLLITFDLVQTLLVLIYKSFHWKEENLTGSKRKWRPQVAEVLRILYLYPLHAPVLLDLFLPPLRYRKAQVSAAVQPFSQDLP